MTIEALITSIKEGDITGFSKELDEYLVLPGQTIDDIHYFDGKTLLMQAAATGHVPIVSLLLSRGADLNIKDDHAGWTAFMYAASYGREEILPILLGSGALINEIDDFCNTALMHTLIDANLPVITWLVQNGAFLNTRNKSGEAPLMLAAKNGQIEVVKYLLEQVDIYEKDAYGNTALMHGIFNLRRKRPPNQLAILEFLVKKGGLKLINAQNVLRKTALIYAVETNYIEGVRLLLQFSANPNVEDYLNQNALSSALSYDYFLIAEDLVHYGADVEHDICFSAQIDQIIAGLLWSALRPMPESVPVENRIAFYMVDDTEENELSATEPLSISRQNPAPYIAMSKEHNKNLSKHPAVVGKDLANHTPLLQTLIQVVSGYLYGDTTRLNHAERAFTTQKAIIFTETAMRQYVPQPIAQIVSGYLYEEENQSEVENRPTKKRKLS